MRNRRIIKFLGLVIVMAFVIIAEKNNMAQAAPEATKEPEVTLEPEITLEPKVTLVPEATKEPEVTKEPVFYSPKIIVESYNYTVIPGTGESGSKDGESANLVGSSIRLNIILKNTSKNTKIKNMTTVISMPDDNFELISISDTKYYETFKANSTLTVSYDISIGDKTPSGQYTFPIMYDFADERGGQGSGSGYARITVRQPVEVDFTEVVMSPQVVVGDTVVLGFQALNLGNESVYNVRATLEGNGFTVLEKMYIGEIQGNNQGNGTMKVQMSGLRGDAIYGSTTANITFCYEDKDGREYTKSQEISTTISTPFMEETNEEEAENQWWMVVVIVGILVAGFAVAFTIRTVRRSRM